MNVVSGRDNIKNENTFLKKKSNLIFVHSLQNKTCFSNIKAHTQRFTCDLQFHSRYTASSILDFDIRDLFF